MCSQLETSMYLMGIYQPGIHNWNIDILQCLVVVCILVNIYIYI